MAKVAILLTCYNRKKSTIECLDNLLIQTGNRNEDSYEFYICDDASTDGTYEEICERFPVMHIIRSKGNLFWCKGMYQVMRLAVKEKSDFYLMVNDDVNFNRNMLDRMFAAYDEAGILCGIVGSTYSSKSGKTSYGGHVDNSRCTIIEPNGKIQPCDLVNWNCFLIPDKVVERIGLIDHKYEHGCGDYDYSIRMRKAGIPIYVANDYIGVCENNDITNTFRDITLPRKKRIKNLFSNKGLPMYSFFRYNIRKEGVYGFLKALYGYSSIIFYILLGK